MIAWNESLLFKTNLINVSLGNYCFQCNISLIGLSIRYDKKKCEDTFSKSKYDITWSTENTWVFDYVTYKYNDVNFINSSSGNILFF